MVESFERPIASPCLVQLPLSICYMEYIIDKLFVVSFILNKIKDFPLGPLSILLGNLALCCIAVGFTLQLITTNYYEVEYTETKNLFNYQTRAQLNALIGTAVTWFCILHPGLWLPCFWLMCANNILWLYNEHTRIDKPSIYPSSPKQPIEYCRYIAWMTLSMLSSALANTLSFSALEHQQTILTIGRIFNWGFSLLGIRSLYASAEATSDDALPTKPSV
jgi:hypothetical protein